ncbi:YjbH domain-containing protein [Yoonia sp.]|uniref:YjbH domain-containing protein n=1 Tax=Yoonia sp. TaxID=2212373 RepID=UPI0019E5D804|nr:YjbH domain-containing protein [Yoonia sp.]MBE0414328.1 YjbH domain-containing protein [Yoonia sp.]
MRNALFGPAMVVIMTGGTAMAQPANPTYSLNGTPGLLEMPTAQSAAQGTFALTVSYVEGFGRTTLNFQVTDRLSLSLRYGFIDLYDDPTSQTLESEFARGFDLRYRLNDETAFLPSVAIGLQDFLTPGRLGAEYVVASKTVGDNLTVTAGLGWGGLATRNGFTNPFSGLQTRPAFDVAEPEGQLTSDQWFHGDAALFGGLEYQINDKWGVKAEYSSSAYPETPFKPAIKTDSPYNLGLTYRPAEGVQLGLGYLYGNSVAVSGSLSLNANNRPGMSGRESAPAPVNVRPANDRSWDQDAAPPHALRSALATLLEREGITVTQLAISGDTARLRYINTRYRSQAQAMGRAARMMTQVMPAAIEVFTLEPEAAGIPLSATTIRRSDLEQFENRPGAAEVVYQRADFGDADLAPGLTDLPAGTPAFAWGLGPYFTLIPAASGGSVTVDAGLSLRGVYRLQPNLVLSGAIGQSLINAAKKDPVPDSTPDIQNVRTDAVYYGDDGVPVLQNLALAYYARPGRDLYGRVSGGYLEPMFGGISAELLWKPVQSRLGLGIEVNYAAQRDTDMLFGFDEYDYDTVTGHVSAYYDFGNGYHTQLDVGRYLAGDWGATLSLDREFDNGVRVGGYVTQTDMAYTDFGDGSYNKGVRVTIPQDFLTGKATQSAFATTLQTQIGDGGARLAVDGRLYDLVRDAHTADLSDTWGRFWR